MNDAKILIVDDEEHILFILTELLIKQGYQVIKAKDGRTALNIFRQKQPQIVLLDYKLPDLSGIEILKKITSDQKYSEVIMMTAHGNIEQAVTSMKLGAYYYLTKPFNNDEIILQIKNALEKISLKQKIVSLQNQLSSAKKNSLLIGDSKALHNILEQIQIVAKNDIAVYIEGETGTGKDLIARSIHEKSDRKKNPYVAVDCGAIPPTLFEAEMFGYEKGAFTDAKLSRIGKFEQANTGTIFLDEITNLSLDMQAKLLRVIQNKKISRIGSKKEIAIDVRIISASNQNILKKVEEKKFRNDIFYRICEFKIDVPALKERKEDIPILVNNFIKKYAIEFQKKVVGITPEALQKMINFDWPGNVRELINVIKRAVLVSNSDKIDCDAISFINLAQNDIFEDNNYFDLKKIDAEADRKKKMLIQRKIEELKGNKTQAAKELKISRNKLYELLNS